MIDKYSRFANLDICVASSKIAPFVHSIQNFKILRITRNWNGSSVCADCTNKTPSLTPKNPAQAKVIFTINEEITKFTRSAIKALGIVWRVRVIPTEP